MYVSVGRALLVPIWSPRHARAFTVAIGMVSRSVVVSAVGVSAVVVSAVVVSAVVVSAPGVVAII